MRAVCALLAAGLLAVGCTDGRGADESPGAAAPESATVGLPTPADPGTVLRIGTLLPQTGDLAHLGPPQVAGVDLAVEEINAAGGVLGADVELDEADSGDAAGGVAAASVERLLAAGADVVIGAAASDVSLTVIDTIIGAGVVQFSPANTAPDFTDYDDDGLYFRTAPSDVLQGRVLAEVIVADGADRVAVLARRDAYGEGLARFLGDGLQAAAGAMAGDPVLYDPAAPAFDAEIQAVVATEPDAIAIIGFDETARIIQGLIGVGWGPAEVLLYGADGNMSNGLYGGVTDPGVLEGFRGTTPLVRLPQGFRRRLLAIDPNLADFAYAAEAYDAVTVAALAAVTAGSDAGTDLAERIPGVTRGGTTCTDFRSCRDLLAEGEDIDYDGVSGPIEMDDAGDRTQASYAILTFGPDNRVDESAIEYRIVGLPEEAR